MQTPMLDRLCYEHLVRRPLSAFEAAWAGQYEMAVELTKRHHEGTESEEAMAKMFVLKKEWKDYGCAAMRCMDVKHATVVGAAFDVDAPVVPVCKKHLAIAVEELKLDEVPGSYVLSAAPGVPPAEVVEVPPMSTKQMTATPAALTEVVKNGVAEELKESTELVELAKTFQIVTQEDLRFAAECLADVKGKSKRLTERMQEITKPLNESLSSIRALFKAPLDHYATVEKELKARIVEAKEREEAEAAAAAAKARELAAAGDFQGVQNAVAGIRTLSNVDGVGISKTWTFEVEDALAVPRDFLTIDTAAVKVAMKLRDENGVPHPIPGIRFFQTTGVSSRSAT